MFLKEILVSRIEISFEVNNISINDSTQIYPLIYLHISKILNNDKSESSIIVSFRYTIDLFSFLDF